MVIVKITSIEIIGGDFDFEIDYSPSICEGNSGFANLV